jgi:hypothetical protein
MPEGWTLLPSAAIRLIGLRAQPPQRREPPPTGFPESWANLGIFFEQDSWVHVTAGWREEGTADQN